MTGLNPEHAHVMEEIQRHTTELVSELKADVRAGFAATQTELKAIKADVDEAKADARTIRSDLQDVRDKAIRLEAAREFQAAPTGTPDDAMKIKLSPDQVGRLTRGFAWFCGAVLVLSLAIANVAGVDVGAMAGLAP